MRYDYVYLDPYLLNRLANFAAEEDSHLTVKMHPDCPGLLEILPRIYDIPDEEFKALMDELGVCHRYALEFKYGVFSGRPEIVSLKPFCTASNDKWCDVLAAGKSVIEEFYPPEDLFKDKKFFYISFEHAGSSSIPAVKRAVNLAIEKGYVATSLDIGLRPRSYTHDHYGGGLEYSAHLFAGNGKITIYGDFKNEPKRLLEYLGIPELALAE